MCFSYYRKTCCFVKTMFLGNRLLRPILGRSWDDLGPKRVQVQTGPFREPSWGKKNKREVMQKKLGSLQFWQMGGPALILMQLVFNPLVMSIYSILPVAGISASCEWKILGGCVNEKCALTRHTSDRRLCKRCVIEKNLSWLAAALLPILSDSSLSLESLPRRDVY